MKRILSILLCLILIGSMLTLASCDETTVPSNDETTENTDDSNNPSSSGGKTPKEGVDVLNGKTPKELYEAAIEKVSAMTNYELITNQVIDMTYQNQSLPTVNQVVISKLNGQEQYVKSTNDADASANMEIWYVNDWLYTTMGGSSVKANITWQQMQDNFMPEGASGSGLLMNIPESWFKNIRFEKDGELYFIEFTVSGEDYLKYMQSTALGDMIKDATDVTYIVYFDANGELGDIITKCDYVVTESGYTINCHLESTSTLSNVGNVTITAPEGNFIDVTGNMNLK
ncbi:MAG: hypothetical protein J6Q82_03425 [Clostridia bacterium]|nr:hypothetical protein [Clostridia bacterium]